jgi:hypothetical protein
MTAAYIPLGRVGEIDDIARAAVFPPPTKPLDQRRRAARGWGISVGMAKLEVRSQEPESGANDRESVSQSRLWKGSD